MIAENNHAPSIVCDFCFVKCGNERARICSAARQKCPQLWTTKRKKTKTSEPVTSLCRSSVCRSSLRGTSASATTAYAHFRCNCLCGQNANTAHITLTLTNATTKHLHVACGFVHQNSMPALTCKTARQLPHESWFIRLKSSGGICWPNSALFSNLPERTSQPASRRCCLGMHLHRLYSTDLRTSPTVFKWNKNRTVTFNVVN